MDSESLENKEEWLKKISDLVSVWQKGLGKLSLNGRTTE